MRYSVALSIAGVDPSGGAGIFADIKTFTAFNVYGMGVITSITSQNTYEINSIENVSIDFFKKQIDTVLNDIKPDCVKTGMIPAPEIAEIIYNHIKKYSIKNLVIDPVMISKQKAVLTSNAAIDVIIKKLFPVSVVVTPNIPEASFITGVDIRNVDDMILSCKKIYELGPENILLKGGHMKGNICVDVFFNGKDIHLLKNKRINTKNTHGTGCTLSAAICANISLGKTVYESVKESVSFVNRAIKKSISLGHGNGPLNHMV